MTRHATVHGALFAVALAAAACRRGADNARPPAPAAFEETLTHGEVSLTVAVDPGRVVYDRDMLLTLTLQGPEDVRILLPPLDDRLQGFIVNGLFEQPGTAEHGAVVRTVRARLTPEPGHEHRLAPIPVTLVDTRAVPARTNWFATRPVVFEVTPPLSDTPGHDLLTDPRPVWVHPPFRTVVGYVLLALAAIAVLVVIVRLARRAHEQVALMRMSPRERALKELAVLLARDLVARHRVKDFYLELTMIVRRYIERAHRVRAPEQTTEEFLAAVAGSNDFSPAVVATLREFLQAADLVKFAAHQPANNDIQAATRTARDYIDRDAAHAASRNGHPKPYIRKPESHV